MLMTPISFACQKIELTIMASPDYNSFYLHVVPNPGAVKDELSIFLVTISIFFGDTYIGRTFGWLFSWSYKNP